MVLKLYLPTKVAYQLRWLMDTGAYIQYMHLECTS